MIDAVTQDELDDKVSYRKIGGTASKNVILSGVIVFVFMRGLSYELQVTIFAFTLSSANMLTMGGFAFLAEKLQSGVHRVWRGWNELGN